MNKDYFINSKKKLLIIAGVLLIAVALPITLYLVKQQQDLRGRAATPDKLETEAGVLSSSGVSIASDTLASGGQYVLFVPTPTPTTTPVVTPVPTSAPVSAFIESGGSVTMEAERNHGKFNREGYRWDGAAPGTPQTSSPNYSGTGYMAARPNDDLRTFFEPAFNQGPEATYNINFTTTGVYYVYLRSSGEGPKSDSAHVGLAKYGLPGELMGSMALYYEGEGGLTAVWKWRHKNNDGTRTKINITTPGIYTFHIYMREDGTRIDRIRLSKNPDWVADPNDSAKGPPSDSPEGTF